MGKRILILGNGFDLAHGLPTKYSDFLKFCNGIIFKKENTLKNYIQLWFAQYNVTIEDDVHLTSYYEKVNLIYEYIFGNVWYKYFTKLIKGDGKTSIKGENWIDFESEIRYVIETIDTHTKNITYLYGDIVNEMDNDKIEYPFKIQEFNSCLMHDKDYSVKEIRGILHSDLNKLIKALELYLLIVEDIPIKLISKDISGFYYDYIINFNYTHTYNLNKHYNNLKVDVDEPTEIFYIHGETGKKPNNMVLGIDEYWSEEERDSHTNFTIFKKFAQRIQKKTGVDSYKWIKEISDLYEKNIAKNSNRNSAVAEVHIFGHSLDLTDTDILKAYLESEATDVTIYCKDEATEGEYIANVIKIITEDRLLEKVNQYPPKLKFVIQQPMVSIEEEEKEPLTSGAAT